MGLSPHLLTQRQRAHGGHERVLHPRPQAARPGPILGRLAMQGPAEQGGVVPHFCVAPCQPEHRQVFQDGVVPEGNERPRSLWGAHARAGRVAGTSPGWTRAGPDRMTAGGGGTWSRRKGDRVTGTRHGGGRGWGSSQEWKSLGCERQSVRCPMLTEGHAHATVSLDLRKALTRPAPTQGNNAPGSRGERELPDLPGDTRNEPWLTLTTRLPLPFGPGPEVTVRTTKQEEALTRVPSRQEQVRLLCSHRTTRPCARRSHGMPWKAARANR